MGVIYILSGIDEDYKFSLFSLCTQIVTATRSNQTSLCVLDIHKNERNFSPMVDHTHRIQDVDYSFEKVKLVTEVTEVQAKLFTKYVCKKRMLSTKSSVRSNTPL